jgi:hypothetical protein
MKIQLVIIAILSLLIESCQCECCSCEGALFEANVIVIDMDGKTNSWQKNKYKCRKRNI